jgi:hypothetical protein
MQNVIVLNVRNGYDCASLIVRYRTVSLMKMKPTSPRFKTLELVDVPRSRNGKHKAIVMAILRDLDRLGDGVAFKVPFSELGDTKENVRSALNRAARKGGRDVATATDENFLYVWNVAQSEESNQTARVSKDKQPRIERSL